MTEVSNDRQKQAAAPMRCLLCGLALVCAQSAAAQVPESRPRLWMSPPVFGSLSSTYTYTFTSPALALRTHAPYTAVRGLLDIGASPRGPSIRGGIGFDLDLPDAGKLHLDVLPARDVASQGMRWQVGGDDRRLEGKLWSLGACLEVVREPPRAFGGFGQRRVELAPQLLIDADRLLDTQGKGKLILQRVHWADQQNRDTGVGTVWQLRMVWQF